jgi:hypothetical protein
MPRAGRLDVWFVIARGEYDSDNSVMTDMNADSSVELLVKAQAGDGDALNGLLHRYMPRLK